MEIINELVCQKIDQAVIQTMILTFKCQSPRPILKLAAHSQIKCLAKCLKYHQTPSHN